MADNPPKPASDLIERTHQALSKVHEAKRKGGYGVQPIWDAINLVPDLLARLKELEDEVERLMRACSDLNDEIEAAEARAEAAEDLSERRRVGLDDAIAEVAKWSQACRAAEGRVLAAEAKLASLSPKEQPE